MSPDELPRLGGAAAGPGWSRARDRCLACGADGLLDEGYLRVRTPQGAQVEWVGSTSTADFHFGFAAPRDAFPLWARRCRECRHVQFYAEDGD